MTHIVGCIEENNGAGRSVEGHSALQVMSPMAFPPELHAHSAPLLSAA
jgi:hypothetical protein